MAQQKVKTQSPLDIRYIRQVKWYLKGMGLWPDDSTPDVIRPKTGPPIMAFVFTVLWTYIIVSGFVFLKHNLDKLSFFEVGHMWISSLVHIVNLGCFATPCYKVYGEVLRDFLHQIHLVHVKHKSEYAMKLYKKVGKLSTMGTIIVIFQIHLGVNLFNLTAVLDNYNSGVLSHNRPLNCTYQFTIDYSFPFDKSNIYRYIFLAIANYLINYIAFVNFCLYWLMICLILFHVIGHLSILKHKLKSIPRPTGDVYTQEEELQITQLLIEIVSYHKMIVNFIRKTSQGFGSLICLYYSFHLYSGCILLLELSKWDRVAFGKYFPITAVIVQQLMQISLTFEYVKSGIEALPDAIYNVPWQYMGKTNRRMVLLMLMQMQQPATFKALGMVPVGVQTMAEILKGCFSYFLMLRTLANTE